MKKISSLLLSSLVVLGLAGCGPKENDATVTSNDLSTTENSEPTELLVWEDQAKGVGIEDAIKKFEEENNVKITMVEKSYADHIEDLRLDGPTGTGPDVITIPSDQVGTAVTEGLLKELTVDDELKGIYTEAAMQSQTIDGKVYGLPKAVETQILFYNKDLISEEELPNTTDEWFEFSKNYSDGEKYGLLALWDTLYYAQGVMGGFGSYVFGEKDGELNPEDLGLANEGAIEGAEYIKKFYDEKVFPSGIIGEQGINVLDSLFTEGKAVAVISGPWNVEPYKEAGINYGVKELPMLPNGEHMGSFIGVKSYNVSSYTKHPELAEAFVKFITNEENSKVRYEKTKEVPAVLALAEDPSVQESEAAAAIALQSQYAELMPGITAMNSVWIPIDQALQTIATGKAEPKDALEQAVEQIANDIEATTQQ
ncbi:MAG TPA: extracellular solute-binding protein [Globicatella sulfidifaciens]|nr:extracellular solute-binding protein [Globicatella sulfidifaciens]